MSKTLFERQHFLHSLNKYHAHIAEYVVLCYDFFQILRDTLGKATGHEIRFYFVAFTTIKDFN